MEFTEPLDVAVVDTAQAQLSRLKRASLPPCLFRPKRRAHQEGIALLPAQRATPTPIRNSTIIAANIAQPCSSYSALLEGKGKMLAATDGQHFEEVG
jgi:hypothetical protein